MIVFVCVANLLSIQFFLGEKLQKVESGTLGKPKKVRYIMTINLSKIKHLKTKISS